MTELSLFYFAYQDLSTMPCSSSSKQKSLKANTFQSAKKTSSGSQRKGIVLAAPKALDTPPLHEKRICTSPKVYHPPEMKKKRWKKKTKKEKERDFSHQEWVRVNSLERRWRAVAAYCRRQSMFRGFISNQDAKKIAEEYNLTLETLKRLVEKALKGESLLRKSGSGQKVTKFDIGNRCLKEIFDEYGGELSQLTLTELVNRKGVKVSILIS